MMSEVKTLIQNSITEEIEDHRKYLQMAEKAKAEGCDEVFGVACDIAEEEESHARILQYLLEKIGK